MMAVNQATVYECKKILAPDYLDDKQKWFFSL